MIKVGGLFFILGIVFWLWALFDALTADNARVRVMPKVLWFLIVLVFFEFGALVWVLFGRPRRSVPTGTRGGPPRFGGGQLGGGFGSNAPSRRSSGPVGPDDDPDFLRSI